MSGFGQTSRDAAQRLVFNRHADVVAIAHNRELFSNSVSRFRQVPNGLDGDEHLEFRGLIDQFFTPTRIAALEPGLSQIASEIVRDLAANEFDAVTDLGVRFAVHGTSAWLGWPEQLAEMLTSWVSQHRAAIISADLNQTAVVAAEFDAIIADLLSVRRAGDFTDVTAELMTLRTTDGELLSDADITSILRNWTGGDLSSVARCIGVVVAWLAEHVDHQEAFAAASDPELEAAIDEILRLNDPFVSNRRTAKEATEVAGCPVAAGEQVVLNWRNANLDPGVFAGPEEFNPAANRSQNLVYGTGVHVCPGRGLATTELRLVVRALLAAGKIEFSNRQVQTEVEPFAGYWSVPVRLN